MEKEDYPCDHKTVKDICKIDGCSNKTRGKGICKKCGLKRWRNYCRRHDSNGVLKPLIIGKRTTHKARAEWDEIQKQKRGI